MSEGNRVLRTTKTPQELKLLFGSYIITDDIHIIYKLLL